MYKEKIITAMKNYFGADTNRINHALQVINYAEQLIENHNRKDINQEVIIYAAILHDIGIHEAERKYKSTAGKYQEQEGPTIARQILNSFPITEEIIDEVCEIIAHHHSPGNITSLEFKILYDADWLVNLPVECNIKQLNNIETTINRLYLSKEGKKLAKKLFITKNKAED
ncbi:HD domain-containing protein [Halanaerocella petrolearia]